MGHPGRLTERALTFGPEGALVGVWSQPAGLDPVGPAVVMINSGLIHHVGMSRLHVRLARALAEAGRCALRFDLSGIGDSGPAAVTATLEELIQMDIGEAVGLARRRTAQSEVILLGLCSGARDALDALGRHEGVAGIVCLDLIGDFRTWRHHAVHYGRRLFRLQSWTNTVRRSAVALRQMATVRQKPEEAERLESAVLGLRPVTSRHELSERLNAFLGDGGKALFAFSAGLERNYNHRSQLLAAVPSLRRHPGLSLAFFGEADHTFSANEVQDALIERIVGWVETVAGASVGDREAIPTAG